MRCSEYLVLISVFKGAGNDVLQLADVASDTLGIVRRSSADKTDGTTFSALFLLSSV
jgi:hypothetical protein